MKFQLYGRIGYAVGSCHDDRSIDISEEFNLPDGSNVEAMAIEKARGMIQELHEKYSHRTDYTLAAGLGVIREIWETHFEEDQCAVPARPAEKAKSAIPAHFKERLLE
ncbi:MAG TPA: hypothetical protein VMR99_01105 [Candidatus Paceibacterota bacterium]|nr:hypothetical protein [Candidatus Paceibacterota bacterium]